MNLFRVHILGCGSALPTLRHQPTSQVVELRGHLFMIDCGEGVQKQLRLFHINFNRINHIFISHLHGDHCFGLIGTISTFGLLGRTAPLHIYATVELKNILQAQIDTFCSNLTYEVFFHPIDTTIQTLIYEDKNIEIETIPLQHGVPCCGFLFREKPSLPHIKRDMIDFYKIPVSQINNIKSGLSWTLEDGTIIPNNRLVTPAKFPRSYAYCSDTRYIPTLHERLKGVNLLYHEATYDNTMAESARRYNHSTALQAAIVAKEAEAECLILGHYSARYEDEKILLDEAKTVFPNSILAYEGLVIDI